MGRLQLIGLVIRIRGDGMETRKKEVEVYVVGNKEFLDKEEAKAYERRLEEKLNYTFYNVSYSPDLTEGRGFSKSMKLAVKGNHPSNAIIQYLNDNIGKPVEGVMGVAPTNNWSYSKGFKFDNIDEMEKFIDEKGSFGIGDYRRREKTPIVYIDGFGRKIK